MRQIIFLLGISVMAIFSSCESGLNQTGDIELITEQDSLSYAYGFMSIIGQGGMKELGIELNADEYQKGFDFVTSSEEGDYDMNKILQPIQSMSQEIAQRPGNPFTEDDKPFTDVDEFSYAFGAYNASAYVGCGYEVNGAAMCAGMRDAYAGEERIDEGMLNKLSEMFSTGLRSAQMAEAAKDGEENLAKGEAFLTENKTKDGVKVTESGLQYKVLNAGTGTRKPKATETVVVHYEGRFIDGGVFDASIGGAPAEFPLNRVIPGWTEALQLMVEGDKFQLYVPTNLAYGPRGMGRDIGPNETLIFDVELLEIK